MASTDGGSTATGNESSFWDKLGNTFITGINKAIDVELSSDSKNMPDQNDLVAALKKAQTGSGIQPQMLIMGGAFLLIAVVVLKKVL